VRPGHINPLRSRDGGVLVRAGQTEGSVDLARLAGLKPAAVSCEIMREDGEMARRPELETFAKQHGLRFITIAQLVAYRLQKERLVRRIAEAKLPIQQLNSGQASHSWSMRRRKLKDVTRFPGCAAPLIGGMSPPSSISPTCIGHRSMQTSRTTARPCSCFWKSRKRATRTPLRTQARCSIRVLIARMWQKPGRGTR